MKLSKTNRILSYTPLLLMVYSLFCLLLLDNQWYKDNWVIIDYCDIPFYLFATIHAIKYWGKYSFNAKLFFVCVYVYLGFKILDIYFPFNYQTFMFWNFFILVFAPICIIIDKNLNR